MGIDNLIKVTTVVDPQIASGSKGSSSSMLQDISYDGFTGF